MKRPEEVTDYAAVVSQRGGRLLDLRRACDPSRCVSNGFEKAITSG